MKFVVIIGIFGQDGVYLVQLFFEKGYKVYGIYCCISLVNFWCIEEFGIEKYLNLYLVEYDLQDLGLLICLLQESEVIEVYNLVVQSFVGVFFDQFVLIVQIIVLGVLNLFEVICVVNLKICFYQVLILEMFGLVQQVLQIEQIQFYLCSLYGVVKFYVYWMMVNYCEFYDMFVFSGILFNYEFLLCGCEFVICKIIDLVVKIKLGKLDVLELGNLDVKCDWGFVKEYVEGMWWMLQVDKLDIYVLVINCIEIVCDFVMMVFKVIGVELVWNGIGLDEVGICSVLGKILVKINLKFYCLVEVDLLIGNLEKVKCELGWELFIMLEELCEMMVVVDLCCNEVGVLF